MLDGAGCMTSGGTPIALRLFRTSLPVPHVGLRVAITYLVACGTPRMTVQLGLGNAADTASKCCSSPTAVWEGVHPTALYLCVFQSAQRRLPIARLASPMCCGPQAASCEKGMCGVNMGVVHLTCASLHACNPLTRILVMSM